MTACAAGARAEDLLVSAAASLTDAMKQIGREFTVKNPGVTVRFNFGASGALQQQIENGAPVDVFASAGSKEMDALGQSRKIDASTRLDFAGNRLVLLIPLRSQIKQWEDLVGPSVRRVALSNPDSVPSGRYAKETLIKRGLWAAVQPKAVFGHTVRQTLAYVTRGDVDAGIVFASDAITKSRRTHVAQYAVPVVDHVPINYPAAVVTASRHAQAAKRFVAFLKDPAAQGILGRAGFTSIHPMRVNPPSKSAVSPR